MSHAIAAFREGEIAFGDADLSAARRAKERGEEWWLRCRHESQQLAVLDFDLAFEEGRAADARAAMGRLALAKEVEHDSWLARTELQVAWLQVTATPSASGSSTTPRPSCPGTCTSWPMWSTSWTWRLTVGSTR